MKKLVVHFAGGTEVTLETEDEPATVYDALAGESDWLIVRDRHGESHYLAIRQIAYLTFALKQGVGFS